MRMAADPGTRTNDAEACERLWQAGYEKDRAREDRNAASTIPSEGKATGWGWRGERGRGSKWKRVRANL